MKPSDLPQFLNSWIEHAYDSLVIIEATFLKKIENLKKSCSVYFTRNHATKMAPLTCKCINV